MVNKLEALADAIGRYNQIHNPESEAYRLRNPLLIRSFARAGKHETDEEGRRVFSSMLSGYKAGLFDLDLKIRGKSRAGLTPDSVLENLLGVYNIKGIVPIDNVVAFLRRALQDQTLSKQTPMSFFI